MDALSSPLRGTNLRKLRVNKTLHGRSVYRQEHVPGHCVVKYYLRPGRNDAGDLFVRAGTPVTAMHRGKITRIAQRHGRLGVVYVEGKHNGRRLVTVYAHLHVRDAISTGDSVSTGSLLGWVNRQLKDPHLHLEVLIDDKPITAPTAKHWREKVAALCD